MFGDLVHDFPHQHRARGLVTGGLQTLQAVIKHVLQCRFFLFHQLGIVHTTTHAHQVHVQRHHRHQRQFGLAPLRQVLTVQQSFLPTF